MAQVLAPVQLGHAHADRHELGGQESLADCFDQGAGKGARVFPVARVDDAEFLAAQAAAQMALRLVRDDGGRAHEHRVARIMALLVVDDLEIVDVDHQEMQLAAMSCAMHLLGALREHAAVVQARQAVLEGEPRQLHLGVIVAQA
ncbi:hypothetical protein D3C72_1267480 [compost metagenome]